MVAAHRVLKSAIACSRVAEYLRFEQTQPHRSSPCAPVMFESGINLGREPNIAFSGKHCVEAAHGPAHCGGAEAN